MSDFDRETAIDRVDAGVYDTELSTAWDIGDTANGGYASAATLRALHDVTGQPDPLSVTTHFLRPVRGGGQGRITAEVVRQGRTVSVARGTLHHDGSDRLLVTAALGSLDGVAADDGDVGDEAAGLEPVAPHIAPPDECVDRSGDLQGVALAIEQRVEVRLPAHRMVPAGSDDAVIEGWIRLRDGTPPTASVLPLFADAFPPSLFSLLGRVGWVPTIELTVHVRRRPSPGWVQARFECDDLVDGRMIETGTLWDETGAVVARSRQLGLLLQ